MSENPDGSALVLSCWLPTARPLTSSLSSPAYTARFKLVVDDAHQAQMLRSQLPSLSDLEAMTIARNKYGMLNSALVSADNPSVAAANSAVCAAILSIVSLSLDLSSGGSIEPIDELSVQPFTYLQETCFSHSVDGIAENPLAVSSLFNLQALRDSLANASSLALLKDVVNVELERRMQFNNKEVSDEIEIFDVDWNDVKLDENGLVSSGYYVDRVGRDVVFNSGTQAAATAANALIDAYKLLGTSSDAGDFTLPGKKQISFSPVKAVSAGIDLLSCVSAIIPSLSSMMSECACYSDCNGYMAGCACYTDCGNYSACACYGYCSHY